MKFYNLIFIAFLSTIFSCTKKTNNQNDTTKPTIEIVEPILNDTLSLSSEPMVHIEFTTTDDVSLHELNVTVQNNSSVIFTNSPTVHDLKIFAFHEHFMPTGINSVTPLELKITAEDHAGNVTNKNVIFYVKP